MGQIQKTAGLISCQIYITWVWWWFWVVALISVRATLGILKCTFDTIHEPEKILFLAIEMVLEGIESQFKKLNQCFLGCSSLLEYFKIINIIPRSSNIVSDYILPQFWVKIRQFSNTFHHSVHENIFGDIDEFWSHTLTPGLLESFFKHPQKHGFNIGITTKVCWRVGIVLLR